MLTAKEFKDLGVPFVVGDEGETFHVHDAEGFNRLESCFNDDKVTHFAWRPIRTLPDNPKFKYELDTQLRFWRPLLDQSSVKPSEFNFDFAEHVSAMMNFKHKCAVTTDDKPVFTQTMADAGELPPVGSKALIRWSNDVPSEYHECEMVFFIDRVGVVISGGIHYAFDVDTDAENKVTFKPIDTRTPKQKAVDEALELIGYTNDGEVAIHLGQVYDLWNKQC